MTITILVNIISSNQQIREVRFSTERQLRKASEQIKAIKESTERYITAIEMEHFYFRKELLKALIGEFNVNLSFANELLKDLDNYIKGKGAIIHGTFHIDILNANLINNTIRDQKLLIKIIKLKELWIVCNQHLEFMRSGKGMGRFTSKNILLKEWEEARKKFNFYKKNEKKIEEVLNNLPEILPLTKSRIFYILFNLFGNQEGIEEFKKEIIEYEKRLEDEINRFHRYKNLRLQRD